MHCTALRHVVWLDTSRSLCSLFLPAHITARLQASHFYGVCFRCSYGSQLDEPQNVPQPKWTTWWNHSCYTSIPWLSAPHCPKHCNLVRVPRRLQSPCHSHKSRTSQRHQVPRPTRSRPSVLLSLIFLWASLMMFVHRQCLCALCLQHTTLPQQTPLRNSPSRSFCSCVLPNTPSSVQFHSAFMKTFVMNRPPLETRWKSRSPMPPRSSLSPSSLSGGSSPKPSRRVPTAQPYSASRCIYSGLPTQCRFRRCIHPTHAHRVLSWVRLL